jgi:hypothetical protein
MSTIDLATFGPALLVCKAVHAKTGTGASKTSVHISYGQTRSSIAFVTPAFAVDWPMLHCDGDYCTKFCPDQVDKAQYKCDVTDQAHEHADHAALKRYFNALRTIDDKLMAFVHQNQRELLGTRDLSAEGILTKLNASCKAKYDAQDVLLHTKQTLAQRKFYWKGNEVKLRIINAQRDDYTAPIAQGDIRITAAGVNTSTSFRSRASAPSGASRSSCTSAPARAAATTCLCRRTPRSLTPWSPSRRAPPASE